jgi:hypothetical protein
VVPVVTAVSAAGNFCIIPTIRFIRSLNRRGGSPGLTIVIPVSIHESTKDEEPKEPPDEPPFLKKLQNYLKP